MHEFIAQHSGKITGTLSGFDRLVFRGTLRTIAYPAGMQNYLRANQVLLKDFAPHVEQVSQDLKHASLAAAEGKSRPVEYLSSSQVSKEDRARQIAARDGVAEGLICVLTCVEPCSTFEIHRNREAKKLELAARQRKCLFLYHYWIDEIFGFMSARIQTWFPFSVQVCLNGREWLGRQMQKAGIPYASAGNCFPWVEDWARAQQLLDQQLKTNWPKTLDAIAHRLNPVHQAIFTRHPVHYYWSTYQSEWAIDVVFQDGSDLRRLYPRLLHHAMTTFASRDVMRYLGKRICLNGAVPQTFTGQVVTNLKERQEGVRIKHSVNGNSVKLYDKAFTAPGSVLRAETTIQNGSDLRVYRASESDPHGPKSWRQMRRGIADLHRRAQMSCKATERYLDAFAVIEDHTTLEDLLALVQSSTTWHKRRVRALRPFHDDRSLLTAITRAEFAITGFRNRDLQAFFFSSAASSPKEARRRSAFISRKLRMLRAHGLIHKIQGTHRYQLTPTGQKITAAVLAALRSTIQHLTPMAA